MRYVIILVTILAGTVPAGDTDIEVGGNATVKIREQHIFPTPVFYARPVGELAFGSVVEITGEQGDWFSIEAGNGIEGWVHTTALTGAVLSEGSQGTDDSDMIMLAGRGFNSDVEGSYASGKDLPWDEVDDIENITVEPEDLETFLVEGLLIGDLIPRGGR
ncbi:MAG: SH3 domain-containing protein [Candidatus Sabulitectum sp.]|nr:SH3 domain-containing protein [Candidatus Sabulitectum sp.]